MELESPSLISQPNPGCDIHVLLYKFISFYSKVVDNGDMKVDLACISEDFCVHVGKCLFLNPWNSFSILAVRFWEVETIIKVGFMYCH